MKLALGTVQFGLDYGVSNAAGRTPEAEVRGIVDLAARNGIEVYDTAPAYGCSESLLGRVLPARTGRIVTKTAKAGASAGEAGLRQVRDTFAASLARLGRDEVYAVLVHDADDLLQADGERLYDVLQSFRDSGRVGKIGISVYDADQIDAVCARFRVDVIQLPLNVLDQRLITNGSLARLKERGIEIHARSAFLQGLLLMGREVRPERFSPYSPVLDRFTDLACELGLTPLQAALGFVAALPEVDYVVCGVNTRRHLEELVAAARTKVDTRAFASLQCDDPALLDPSRWHELS